MRWVACVVVLAIASACGGGAAPEARSTRREGPDVVTAEWTSGDDAVLDAGTPPPPK